MDYRVANRYRASRLTDLIAGQMQYGEGFVSATKNALSAKTKANLTGIKEFFDPLNVVSSLTGKSKLATTLAGRMLGRSRDDINYFSGYSRRIRYQDLVPAFDSLDRDYDSINNTQNIEERLKKIEDFMSKVKTLEKSLKGEIAKNVKVAEKIKKYVIILEKIVSNNEKYFSNSEKNISVINTVSPVSTEIGSTSPVSTEIGSTSPAQVGSTSPTQTGTASPSATPIRNKNVNPFIVSISATDVRPIKKGDSLGNIFGKVYNTLFVSRVEEIKAKELSDNFNEELAEEDERRHKELIDAILKMQKVSDKEFEEDTESLLDKIMDLSKVLLGRTRGKGAAAGKRGKGAAAGKRGKGGPATGGGKEKRNITRDPKTGRFISPGSSGTAERKRNLPRDEKGRFTSPGSSPTIRKDTKNKNSKEAKQTASKVSKTTKQAIKNSQVLKAAKGIQNWVKGIPLVTKISAGAFLVADIGSAIYDFENGEIDERKLRKRIVGSIGAAIGGIGGAELGAALAGAAGSVVPIAGTGAGLLLGGIIGGIGGAYFGEDIANMLFDYFVENPKAPEYEERDVKPKAIPPGAPVLPATSGQPQEMTPTSAQQAPASSTPQTPPQARVADTTSYPAPPQQQPSTTPKPTSSTPTASPVEGNEGGISLERLKEKRDALAKRGPRNPSDWISVENHKRQMEMYDAAIAKKEGKNPALSSSTPTSSTPVPAATTAPSKSPTETRTSAGGEFSAQFSEAKLAQTDPETYKKYKEYEQKRYDELVKKGHSERVAEMVAQKDAVKKFSNIPKSTQVTAPNTKVTDTTNQNADLQLSQNMGTQPGQSVTVNTNNVTSVPQKQKPGTPPAFSGVRDKNLQSPLMANLKRTSYL